MVSEYLALLRRELKSLLREKTILFAIVVQLFIASFSSIILIGIMAFYDPTSIAATTKVNVKVGVVGDTSSPMLEYLRDNKLTVKRFLNLSDAEAGFQSGQVDTVMFIPEGRAGVVNMKLILPELDAKKTLILMVLNEPLKRYENYLRQVNGVQLNYISSGGKPYTTYEFLYSVIIPVLMFLPSLIAGSIVIDTVSEELEDKTFDTLMSAPVSLGQVLAAKISAAVITASIQMVMWVGLLRLNSIIVQKPTLVILASVIIAATLSVGTAIIALYFKDRERAQFVYSIALVATIGGSYFLSPSPFNLIARLAAGNPDVGVLEVALYTVPLIMISLLFINMSGKLTLMRR